MHVNELKAKSPQQLLKMAEGMGIENPSQLNVQQLRFAVMRVYAADKKVTLIGDGVLERMQDGFGFLRAPESNYLAGPDDLYVSPQLIKKYGLKTGDYVEGQIQAPAAETERYFALETIGASATSKPVANFGKLVGSPAPEIIASAPAVQAVLT